MTVETWLLFCLTETVLCFTPGPAVLTVVSLALTTGARAGIGASLGILAANAVYFVLSATGIGAILLASYELFFLVKWVGAAYLVWLGLRMLVSRANALEPAGASTHRSLRPFTHGVVTQGANPKALVFFTALLPQFIQPRSPVPLQVAILAVSSILIELVVLSAYVAVCRQARGMMQHPGFATSLNRAGGALLIGARTAGPILLVALVVGLLVGVLQTATQINESSISFAAKLVAVSATVLFLGSFALGQLVEYTERTIASMADVAR